MTRNTLNQKKVAQEARRQEFAEMLRRLADVQPKYVSPARCE